MRTGLLLLSVTLLFTAGCTTAPAGTDRNCATTAEDVKKLTQSILKLNDQDAIADKMDEYEDLRIWATEMSCGIAFPQ